LASTRPSTLLSNTTPCPRAFLSSLLHPTSFYHDDQQKTPSEKSECICCDTVDSTPTESPNPTSPANPSTSSPSETASRRRSMGRCKILWGLGQGGPWGTSQGLVSINLYLGQTETGPKNSGVGRTGMFLRRMGVRRLFRFGEIRLVYYSTVSQHIQIGSKRLPGRRWRESGMGVFTVAAWEVVPGGGGMCPTVLTWKGIIRPVDA